MEDLNFIIENVETGLEDAENLLLCFIEFCEDEGMRCRDTQLENCMAAVTFTNRLPQFFSMLHLATGIIAEQKKRLNTVLEA